MPNCKDCLHVEVCSEFAEGMAAARGLKSGNVEEIAATLQCDDCDHFKDRSRFVELPCKVEDFVYFIKARQEAERALKENMKRMTLETAIVHCRDKAVDDTIGEKYREENAQLAIWLEELKVSRLNDEQQSQN